MSRSQWFVFSLTHFGLEKYTFTDNTYCQQVIVTGSFKRTSFLVHAHVSHKNSKLIIFSAYLVCITKGADKWVKFDLQWVKL